MKFRFTFLSAWISSVCTAIIAALACEVASAQVEMAKPVDEVTRSFYLDAISFASLNSLQSRLDVFVQVGYDNLSFVKHGDLYDASYDVTVSILDSAKSLVSEKSWTEAVKEKTFDETTSPRTYNLSEQLFNLNPGHYLISAILRDNESKASLRILRQILVSDYHRPDFSLSDIMLVGRLTIKEGKRSIVPAVSGNVGDAQGAFYAFFEAYNTKKIDTVRFIARVINEKREVQLEVDTVQVLMPGRNEILMQIAHTSLSFGDYRLFIAASGVHDTAVTGQEYLAVTNRTFIVRWAGMPRTLKDIDAAISQLRWIAKDSELDSLKAAKTLQEKQERFLAFWKKRSTNPNVSHNVRMQEYYGRVEYANKHFTRYIEGWRTDMGMVYILFGPPSNVDRHPFEIGSKPYEVWSYYDLNAQLVFVDETGFGDYRLITNIGEFYNRIRN